MTSRAWPAPEAVQIVRDPRTAGVVDVVLCDTLGQAAPAEVSALVGRVHRERPGQRIVFHGHDTWGRASRTPWPR